MSHPINRITARLNEGADETPAVKPAVRVPKPANMNQQQLQLVSTSAVLEEGQPPRAGILTVIAIMLLLVGGIVWAAGTQVTNSTMAPGRVTPTGAVVEIQHYEGGIVASVPVEEGAMVEAGDILMVLDPTSDDANLQQMLARQAFLSIATERLKAEAFGREPDFDAYLHEYPELVMNQIDILNAGAASLEAERSVLLSRVDQRMSDIEIYRNQVNNLQQQLAVVGEQLNMRRTLLERGLASRLTVLDVQRDYTNVEGELVQARTNLARAEQAVEEARHSADELELRYHADAIEELGSVSAELAEVNESLIALRDRVQRREVRSPTRGLVNHLAANLPGQVIEPGQPVASVVPTEDGLIVEAKLPPTDVGYVAVGQSAEVTVEGFDAATFGTLTGTVTYIAPTTIVTEDGTSYYRTKIALDTNVIGRTGDLHQLIPGMIVQVAIHTGEQSMLSYLISPVYRTLSQSFAER